VDRRARMARAEERCVCGALRRWRESNVAFNIGRIARICRHRRIRGGGKGDIARVAGGEKGERGPEQGGSNGEIRCVRDTQWEGEGEGGRELRAFVG